MDSFITIGRFAGAAEVTPKALRLYAANGLLAPARVDEESGYRYYRPEQVHTARLIGMLRSAGMSLREIRRFLASPDAQRLDAHARRLEDELADRLEALRSVRTIMEEAAMFEVELKQVETQRYVSKTRRVHVAELPAFIDETIAELTAGGADGPAFAVYHGQVNEQDDGPVEVGVPRADGNRELAGGEVAYTTIAGEQCDFPEILGAYDAVSRWVRENDRELACPPREVYLSALDEPLRMEIVWQLR
jgi:DNA-binding transcriptional MerR regulator